MPTYVRGAGMRRTRRIVRRLSHRVLRGETKLLGWDSARQACRHLRLRHLLGRNGSIAAGMGMDIAADMGMGRGTGAKQVEGVAIGQEVATTTTVIAAPDAADGAKLLLATAKQPHRMVPSLITTTLSSKIGVVGKSAVKEQPRQVL